MTRKPRSVRWGISAALIVFGVMMLAAVGIQAFSSQLLLEHHTWLDMLRSVSADHAARVQQGEAASLPSSGVIRSWYIATGDAAARAPLDLLAQLPPGYHMSDDNDGDSTFHALIVDLPGGRLGTVIDISELENQQNRDALFSSLWILVVFGVIAGVISWLNHNLVKPVRDLAERMQTMDPGTMGERLPTTYRRAEIQIIAQASNAHLERVEQFIARERSLLDQASHEFRTPIAVIAGAVDVLRLTPLPDASKPALNRIAHAVEDLSETMVALLYLAREADPDAASVDVTVLHELLPRLAEDHEHLLRGKSAQLEIGALESTFIAAPDAMVRIAVSNLIRNAIENTETGRIEIALRDGVICVTDSGSGFNPGEAARRYRDSLRHAAPVRGQGLGLFLIGRMCERFGWTLSIEPAVLGGTRATLDVSASMLRP